MLDVLVRGEVFGEWSVLGDRAPPPFATVASEETLLVGASAADVEALARTDRKVAAALTRLACERALRMAERLRDAMVLDAEDRILACLVDLATRAGVPTEAGRRVDLSVTQEDLARMSGCSRETVNRTMTRLISERRLLRRGRRYVLPDRR